MKKLLCFVLALAMIFGCISMVTVAHAEGTEYAGIKVSNFTKSNGQDTLYILEVKNNGYVHQLFFDPLGKLTKVNKHPSDDYSNLI